MHRKQNRNAVFLCLLLLNCGAITAQLGGSATYAFLNLTHSARIAGIGGKAIAIDDADLNFTVYNPALLNASMHKTLVLNGVGYFAGVKYGYAGYAHTINKKIGTMAVGVQYVNYGKFTGADETGVKTGTFTAAEYAFNCIWSRPIDSSFTVGVNIKPLYSSLESYTSFGMACDLGLTYTNQSGLFVAGLVVRNLGMQITTYYKGAAREPIPLDVSLGLSQKLEHAPFRIFITAHNLQKLDMTYHRNDDEYDPENKTNLENFTDKVLYHTVFGIEFMPLKAFYIQAGYNYQRRQEMKVSVKPAMVGFSWGAGLQIKQFWISYGRATYHLAGGTNHISLTIHFADFNKGARKQKTGQDNEGTLQNEHNNSY